MKEAPGGGHGPLWNQRVPAPQRPHLHVTCWFADTITGYTIPRTVTVRPRGMAERLGGEESLGSSGHPVTRDFEHHLTFPQSPRSWGFGRPEPQLRGNGRQTIRTDSVRGTSREVQTALAVLMDP